jgi:hypothetical protein
VNSQGESKANLFFTHMPKMKMEIFEIQAFLTVPHSHFFLSFFCFNFVLGGDTL